MLHSLGQIPSLTFEAVLQMARTIQDELPSSQNRIQPVLQVIHCSKIEANSGRTGNRSKVILSDGVHFVSCIYLKNVLEHLVEFCYVRLLDYNVKRGSDLGIIILISTMEVIYPAIDDQGRIGNPTDIEKSGLLNVSVPNSSGQQQVFSSSMITSPVRPAVNVNPYGSAIQRSPLPTPRIMGSAIVSHITPISELNMSNNNWTIKGRVTSKSPIKTWSNAKGEGSLFFIEIIDEKGIDIRCTFFMQAVDKFYKMIEMSKIYTFSGGRVKVANMQYNKCRSDYEISFDKNAKIHVMQDEGIIAHQHYNFIHKISDIESLEANKSIDLVGVVKHVGECTKLFSKKSGEELVKCDLTLIDDSNIEITYTLWGDDATKASSLYSDQPIVAIRRARVSEFGSWRSLGNGGGIDINPMLLEKAVELRKWWLVQVSVGSSPSRNISKTGALRTLDIVAGRSDIISIKELNMGYNNIERGEYLTIKGHCSEIFNDQKEGGAWYTACPNPDEPCRNLFKVVQSSDGTSWECMKCNKQYPKPLRRWVFRATLEDTSGSTLVTVFNAQAEVLLGGLSADRAYDMTYVNTAGDPYDDDLDYNVDEYDSIFHKAFCQEYLFKCKVSNVMNQQTNVSAIKISVSSIAPIDYLKESTELLQSLETFNI